MIAKFRPTFTNVKRVCLVQSALIVLLGAACIWLLDASRSATVDTVFYGTYPAGTGMIAAGEGLAIPRQAYLQRLRKEAVGWPTGQASEEECRKVLDAMVEENLLAREAMRRGLQLDEEFRTQMNRQLIARLIGQLALSVEKKDVTEADVKARYAEDQHLYVREEQVRVAHLFFAAPEGGSAKAREAAKSKASSALEQARNYRVRTLHFGELAVEISEDESTKFKGGDLGVIDRDTESVPVEVVDVAFGLGALGEVSDVVESSHGFHILRLSGRRAAMRRSVDEVAVEIRGKLLRERRAATYHQLVEELRETSDVTIGEELVPGPEELGAQLSHLQPPPLPFSPSAPTPPGGR